MKHLLIMGRPGIGKTTLLARLTKLLRAYPIDGFLTEELREEGQRMGFWLSPLDGRQVLLAHRQLTHGPRIGPYHVNTGTLDTVGVSVIQRGVQKARVLFLDELGKMELCSRAFEHAVQNAFDHGPVIVATAGLVTLPFLEQIKRRRDVELIPLSSSNRALIEEELTARLRIVCAEDETLRGLQHRADRICELIVSGHVQPIDVEIQQTALREAVSRAFPDTPALYHVLYENRFRRLWQQFHH